MTVARKEGNSMIFVYGNSHAAAFVNADAGCNGLIVTNGIKSYIKRPMSCKTFILNHWRTLMEFLAPFNKQSDYILITAGEHDVRMEFYLDTMTEEVNEYVTGWFDILLKLKTNGYRVIGYSSHPSINIEHSVQWSDKMQELCTKHGIPFLGIMDVVLTPDGQINNEYYQDAIHLGSKILPIIKAKLDLITKESK